MAHRRVVPGTAVRLPSPAVAATFATTAALLLAVAAVQWPLQDPAGDLFASLHQLPLLVVIAAVVLPASAVLHYLFAGIAFWAASGTRLPFGTATRTQLAAAAANRVVPNGVAGAALSIRCLQRTGTNTAAAVTSMAALTAIGGLTDAAYTALVAGAGPAFGVTGGSRALTALSNSGIQAGQRMPWVLFAVAAGLLVFAVVRRRTLHPRVVAGGLRRAALHLGSLLRRPQQLGMMAAASMGTTAALSVGFATTVLAVGRGHAMPGFATLLVVYLVGAAVGGATPLPAVFGATEAALVAGLVLFGVPTVIAVVATLVFRGVAFWLPVPFGLWTARRLRAARLL